MAKLGKATCKMKPVKTGAIGKRNGGNGGYRQKSPGSLGGKVSHKDTYDYVGKPVRQR